MDRRDFIKASMFAGAMVTAVTARRSARRLAPSDRLRVGFLGTGARAQELMGAAMSLGIDIVSLCDAYTGRAERARERTGGKAAIVADYRKVLDDKTLDAVFIATPDHWHHRMAIDAVDAGKDVYIEKPMTWATDEGLDIIRAVDRTKRVLQVGSQGVTSVGSVAGARHRPVRPARADHAGSRIVPSQHRRRRVAVSDSAATPANAP